MTDALCASAIFLPILTREALSPFLELTASSRCDNVLLEHRLALEVSLITHH